MGTGFVFVDGLRPDREEERLSRRHVMIGKNAGKTFHRRSRLPAARDASRKRGDHPLPIPHDISAGDCAADAIQYEYQGSSAVIPAASRRPDTCLAFSAGAEHVYLTTPCPVEVSPSSRRIINEFFEMTSERLYPVRAGVSLHEAKRTWLKVMFTDEPTYRCNIAMMQACNEVFLHDGASSPKALYYLSETFHHVRRRLEEDRSLSDGTIAIVLSLVIQEQVRGQREQAMVHWQGMQRMVELRGGLQKLEGSTELVLKVCKVDITRSLEHGGKPIYFRDRMSTVQQLLATRDICPLTTQIRLPSSCCSNSDLRFIWQDTMYLCAILNGGQGNLTESLRLREFYEIYVSLCYRLLRARPLDDILEHAVDDFAILHFGMILFMMTIMLYNERQSIVKFAAAKQCLECIVVESSATLDQVSLLWFSTLAFLWTSDDWVKGMLTDISLRAARGLGLTDWTSARTLILNYPWIPALHDNAARAMWQEVWH